MQFIYVEAAIVVIIMAMPLFFTSRHLGKTLGLCIVTAGVAALLVTVPATSRILLQAYNTISRAVD